MTTGNKQIILSKDAIIRYLGMCDCDSQYSEQNYIDFGKLEHKLSRAHDDMYYEEQHPFEILHDNFYVNHKILSNNNDTVILEVTRKYFHYSLLNIILDMCYSEIQFSYNDVVYDLHTHIIKETSKSRFNDSVSKYAEKIYISELLKDLTCETIEVLTFISGYHYSAMRIGVRIGISYNTLLNYIRVIIIQKQKYLISHFCECILNMFNIHFMSDIDFELSENINNFTITGEKSGTSIVFEIKTTGHIMIHESSLRYATIKKNPDIHYQIDYDKHHNNKHKSNCIIA